MRLGGDVPMTGRSGGPGWGLTLSAIAVATLLGVVGGFTLGAATQVTKGPVENSQGAFVSQQGTVYWTWQATILMAIPTPVPAAASTVVTAPTGLPAGGTSWVINPSTAGAESVRWEFHEGTTTPASTELEFRFVAGLNGPSSSIRVYLESQAAVPGATVTYYLYWDAGTFPPASLTIESMQVTVLACTSVGHCP